MCEEAAVFLLSLKSPCDRWVLFSCLNDENFR